MAYPGGKNGAGTYQKLINLMPPHEVYIEPFLGGGAIMRLKRAARESIGLDLSASVVAQWRSLIAGKSESGALFSANSGDSCRRKTLFPAMLDPKTLTVRRGDGIRFLEQYDFQGNELVYCDPPYVMSTKSRKLYKYELPDREHRRLLRCIRELTPRARIIISGYDSRMYREALVGWNSLQFPSMTRGGRVKTEYVWYNFPQPVELHDYRYLGENFRQREQIKRMKSRWTARLARMQPLKRQALLAAIAQR
jgi:site-specific DNA-adenine methylase